MARRSDSIPGRTWVVVALLVYLLFFFWIAARFITIAWPGNPHAAGMYAPELERRALLLTTDATLRDLERARATAAKLPEFEGEETVADSAIEQVRSQLRNAAQIMEQARPDIPENPRQWSIAQRTTATQLLEAAITRLAQRSVALRRPERAPDFWRLLCPWPVGHSPHENISSLTGAEYARFTRELVDLETRHPPHLFGTVELELFGLFAALGAAGAAAQALSSLAKYWGTRTFRESWWVYYFARPLIGAALGPTFYIVLRGGLVSSEKNWESLNLFGYAAVAVLVGFFSAEAMENLRSIAGGLFRQKDSKESADDEETPLIETAVRVHVDSREGVLVTGQAFQPKCVVLLESRQVKTEFVSDTELRAWPEQPLVTGSMVHVLKPGREARLSNGVALGPEDKAKPKP